MFERIKKIIGNKKEDIEGWVDITATNKKTGEVVYQNSGNNVVTDWMRHCLLVLLTGAGFSNTGRQAITNLSADGSRNSIEQFTMPCIPTQGSGALENNYHKIVGQNNEGLNIDGYCLHHQQYFWQDEAGKPVLWKYTKANDDLLTNIPTNIYAMFPTKILFGTGKEYQNFDVLKEENETANAAWYNEIKNKYGANGDEANAREVFNSNIAMGCNRYSGSIANNLAAGNSGLIRCRTVNDPNTTSVLNTTSLASKDWGIMGAVKTPYFASNESTEYLQEQITSDGKILKPQYQGVGRPCFIYFRNEGISSTTHKEFWDSPSDAICVTLSKDSAKSYLHRISFYIYMPAQTGAESATGAYYPYNGYILKQMGLFNDTLLKTAVTESTEVKQNYAYNNMPCGMMLAKKNITPFYKNADTDMRVIWTLSI